MKLRKTRRGFTIVELVIVVAVIGVLAAVLIPTFINLTNKANKASDNSLVANLNTALAGREGEPDDTHNYSMHDAIEDLEIWGYKFENLTTKANEKLLWNIQTNRFCLEDKADLSTYKPEDYWKIVKSTSEMGDYSGYAHTKFNQTEVEVTAGFDAGDVTTITKITYNRSTATSKKSVVLRGNSNKTTLSVDAPLDHVRKEGEFGLIEKEITAKNSFVDNGTTGYVNLSGGRFVFTENTKVDFLFLNIDLNDADKALYITYEAGATKLTAEQLGKPQLGTALGDSLVRLVEVEDESTGTTETIYAKGGSTFEENEIYVSTNGGAPVSVSADTASETAKAVANAYVEGTGAVETGLSEDEIADVMDEVASEAVDAEFEKKEGNENFVARIGQEGYNSLADAIAAANASETALSISLLKDVQQSGSLLMRNSMSLKGGNHTITTVGTATSGNMAAFDICDLPEINPITVNVQDLVINSTKHARVFLLNADYPSYEDPNVLNVENLNITTDGEALYSNGPAAINARNCEFNHEGQYLAGKDAVYYSALIVGYNGTLNVYDCKVSSFGNGAATFPSGGTINIYNTEITSFDDFVDASTGYLFWARHEKSYDTGAYKDYCGSAIINVYSGTFAGPYKVTDDGHTDLNRDAEINLYGGNYQQDPSLYVVSGHTATQNADGTWTVK